MRLVPLAALGYRVSPRTQRYPERSEGHQSHRVLLKDFVEMNWQEDFKIQGYVQFRGLTPAPLLTRALKAIESDLATNYDAARQAEYDNRSYCPAVQGAPEIMDLLIRNSVYELLDATLGDKNFRFGDGQIAIRRAHNSRESIPPTPHLDGFATPLNGVPADKIYNHTALVGVFLTRVPAEFAGNLTVWPGSHYACERY